MEILFHPSFDSGYYLDWNLETIKLGKKIVGTAGLLDYLSLHNGLSGRFVSDGERAASYLSDVGKCTEGSWIEGPFKNDSMGVAKCLLGWRDLLIMAGWTPDRCGTDETPKLQLLSSIEGSWKARIKGSTDRWLELATLAAKQPLVDEGDCIKCFCAKEQLPLLVQKVLVACHAVFAEYPDEVRIPDGLKVEVLHYNDLLDAYRQVAAGSLKGDLFINRDNVSLNHVLLAWGKPLADATIADSNPLSLQLFKLSLSVFSRPLNIQNLLSYLLLPVGPVPRRLRTALANVLISDGGFGEIAWDELKEEDRQALKAAGISSKWQHAIWEYVEDKEGTSKLTRVERESKLCFLAPIVEKAYVPGAGIPVQTLKDYIGKINQWAANKAHSDKENEEETDEELNSQLATVISYFKQLLESLGDRENITYDELEKSIGAIYQPTSIVQARAQLGSIPVIERFEQMVDAPQSLVWLDCCGADVLTDPYDFLSAKEREWLNGQDGICIPQLQTILELNRKEMILALARVKDGITLVTSNYHHNQKMMEHPFLAELKMQRGEALNIQEGSTELPLTEEKPIHKVEAKPSYHLGKIAYAGRSESNTSIDTLINYPFDYTVHYVAKLGEPSKKVLASLYTTKGLVAHLVIQKMIDMVKDCPEPERPAAISDLVREQYDTILEDAVQTTGLILLLRENKVEYHNFRFLLKRSIETLVLIMKHKSLIPVACELKHEKPIFSDGSEFNARIDMELKDRDGHAVIFDFKWTYSPFYGGKIKDGTAVQLELYRKELGKDGKTVAAVGYYLMPKCVLETSDFDNYKVGDRLIIHHIDPPADSDLFNKIQNSVFERREEIKSGDIEEGEEMDVISLPYSQALTGGKDMLWPGKPSKGRATKANPNPPVEKVTKESKKVFVDEPESRFQKKGAKFNTTSAANEKPTTYPLLKGRLK